MISNTKAAQALLSSLAMAPKIENFIVQIVHNLDSPETKNRLLEVAVLANSLVASMGPSVSDAIEKVITLACRAGKRPPNIFQWKSRPLS